MATDNSFAKEIQSRRAKFCHYQLHFVYNTLWFNHNYHRNFIHVFLTMKAKWLGFWSVEGHQVTMERCRWRSKLDHRVPIISYLSYSSTLYSFNKTSCFNMDKSHWEHGAITLGRRTMHFFPGTDPRSVVVSASGPTQGSLVLDRDKWSLSTCLNSRLSHYG